MKQSAVAYSNLVGSNTFDLLFVLGLGAVLGSGIAVPKTALFFDFPFLIIALLLAIVLMRTRMVLSRREAIGLIALFAAYFIGRALIALT